MEYAILTTNVNYHSLGSLGECSVIIVIRITFFELLHLIVELRIVLVSRCLLDSCLSALRATRAYLDTPANDSQVEIISNSQRLPL